MKTKISQNVAYAILRARGWDEIGATEILISIIEDSIELTVENVTRIAMDYEDRWKAHKRLDNKLKRNDLKNILKLKY